MSDRSGFIEQQYAFAAHIRDPAGHAAPPDIEDRRMAVYRELFYNNVEGFLANSFPVLRKLLDDERWHALARDFFSRHRSHSPLFAEIPQEFLNYLEQERGEDEGDPPFLRELAHYEWVELALSIAEAETTQGFDPQGDLLDGAPYLSALAWPLTYRYPVHRIGPEFIAETPGEQPTYLMAYRNRQDDVSFVELNPVSARLFAILQGNAGMTGRAALQIVARELRHPDPGVVIHGGQQMLEQWRELGIVLGIKTPGPSGTRCGYR
jgi:hypothetical protein